MIFRHIHFCILGLWVLKESLFNEEISQNSTLTLKDKLSPFLIFICSCWFPYLAAFPSVL